MHEGLCEACQILRDLDRNAIKTSSVFESPKLYGNLPPRCHSGIWLQGRVESRRPVISDQYQWFTVCHFFFWTFTFSLQPKPFLSPLQLEKPILNNSSQSFVQASISISSFFYFPLLFSLNPTLCVEYPLDQTYMTTDSSDDFLMIQTPHSRNGWISVQTQDGK